MHSRREFLKDWKDRLLSDPKALGQWLRNRNMSSEPLAVTHNGCVAKTPFEIGVWPISGSSSGKWLVLAALDLRPETKS